VPVDDAAWKALDPAQRCRRTLDAVWQLLLREAREQPLLLIFEDLHWINGETQALLDALVGWMRAQMMNAEPALLPNKHTGSSAT